jgi:serine/threonine protein kinase/tetratricopeptide (TPR) repeat protein
LRRHLRVIERDGRAAGPAAAGEDELPLFAQALADGSEVPGYRIKRVLGAGGFAITYLAEHLSIGNEVAIKEYLPRGIAVRAADGSVRALAPSAAGDLAWGLERFRDEARTLGKLKHPNIVPVLNYIEANGTAYAVMEFIAGETLEARIARQGALSAAEMAGLVPALLAGVEAVHDAGFLHRDIKPSNIMLRADGTPVLIDFGAARQALSAHSHALTAILSEGYAPYEQYQTDSDQGRWTDIYALGATLYRCATGEQPVAATNRVNARVRGQPDPLPAASALVHERFPAPLLAAIDRAISLIESERPQSVAELRAIIASVTPPRAASADAPETPAPPAPAADTLLAGHAPRAEVGQTLLVGVPPASRPAAAAGKRSSWPRRAAFAGLALVLTGAAAYGYVAYERQRAAVAAQEAEARRVAAAEAKRRADEEERRRAAERAAAEAETEAQASAARELAAGVAAKDARNYDEALTRLAAAIATGKLSTAQHTEALLARTAAWIGKGDFARAYAEASEAVRVNPDSAESRLERGRIGWHRQQWESSLVDFNEAIRLAPDQAEGYSLRGIVWYHKGDVDRAIADYGEALKRDPQHAGALFNRGLAWHRKGDDAKAAEDFRAALRSNPPPQVAANARRMLELIGAGE